MEQVELDLDVHWSLASKIVSLVTSCKGLNNLALVVVSPAERVLLVAVSAATEAQSMAVAVSRLAVTSTVSC